MRKPKTPTVRELVARIEELERKIATQPTTVVIQSQPCLLPHYPCDRLHAPAVPERPIMWAPPYVITCDTTSYGSVGTKFTC
jgi:hypothetical protein